MSSALSLQVEIPFFNLDVVRGFINHGLFGLAISCSKIPSRSMPGADYLRSLQATFSRPWSSYSSCNVCLPWEERPERQQQSDEVDDNQNKIDRPGVSAGQVNISCYIHQPEHAHQKQV
jgi:hypothetical protein